MADKKQHVIELREAFRDGVIASETAAREGTFVKVTTEASKRYPLPARSRIVTDIDGTSWKYDRLTLYRKPLSASYWTAVVAPIHADTIADLLSNPTEEDGE